ncbi:MAG: hypothetical protein GX868_05725, partial [Actinobacteria bacterium]|nr:hypothetical protein [Actinomycetota bacterium]
VSLVTTDVETVPYLLQTPTGPVWKAQRFRLLFAHPSGPDATEHLRASEHAINVFVNALDLDIEAAQIANEAQMRALIERGAVESAAQLAQVAQYQSAQYLERTRRIVADTLLDPDAHDWINAVPKMLNDALSHVADRLNAEAEITKALTEQRTGAVEMDVLNRTNELIERLRDCRHRHNELHQHLIEARARHRAAVNDRLTRPPRATHRIDIGTDLLAPYLRCSTAITAAAAERMVAAIGGINVAWMPSLTAAIADLCSPPRESAGGEEYDEPDFEMADESDWWEPYEDAVEALLGEITAPVRLTQLLARADDVAESLVDADGDPLYPSLLAAAVVHAAHRLWTPLLAGRDAGDALLVALDDGRRIDTDAVSAADLLVVPAEITGDIDDAQVAAPVQLNPQPSDELLEETAS